MSSSFRNACPYARYSTGFFIESIPFKFRVGRRRTKILHKMLAETFLPAEIVNRPKKGFHVPISDWSRGIWKDRLEEKIFSRQDALHFSYLHRNGIQEFLEHPSIE